MTNELRCPSCDAPLIIEEYCNPDCITRYWCSECGFETDNIKELN